MVQLDHMSRGRVILGTGPGALPSDAYMLGIDPMTQRDRQDEAIGVLQRLFRGERVTHKSDWFTLQDARLQLFPLQEELPMATASSISPSGMTLAGKYGIGVLSIGSNSDAGLAALPTQWSFAEESAKKHGQNVDRKNWRVLLSWHIAETREQAAAQAGKGLMRWHNEYTVGTLMRPGAAPFKSADEAVELTAYTPNAASVIGTPDDLVAMIRKIYETSGGFGVVLGFGHDWANREDTLRSWDLVARYVIPEVNGFLEGYRTSRQYVIDNREWFEKAGQAVLQKIMSHEGAAAALQAGRQAGAAMQSPNAPDLDKAAAEAKK
jgi:limonene 1,2-monooxygenase